MAASEPMVKPPEGDYPPRPIPFTRGRPRGTISEATLTSATMMVADVLAVLGALSLASGGRFYGATAGWIPTFWRGIRTSLSPGYLMFFVGSLLIVNRWYGVYGPRTKQKPWHEHRRTVQACVAAGLLLCGCMYVMHNTMISRGIVA